MIFGILIGIVIGAVFSGPILRALSKLSYSVTGRKRDYSDIGERIARKYHKDDDNN
jgi:hypothetical protein